MEDKSLERHEKLAFGFFRFLKYLLSSLLIIILACWLLFISPLSPAVNNILLILCFMSLTPMSQRALLLSFTYLDRAWSYRLAFLISAYLGSALWAGHAFIASDDLSFWPLAAALFGAFLGALAVTSLDYGFIEVNGSPSKLVKELVHQHHVEALSELTHEPVIKRIFELSFAFLAIIFCLPLVILIVLVIWWEDPGPIFFIKNSVGKNGITFRQFKFRTMVRNAEKHTGLVLASQNDKRILKIGKLLRLTAFDEFPQFLNILRGDMSLVGPRPQRTILVSDYLKTMPQYARRHAVRPGIAGLAQVMSHYHITPLQKLRFDRLYVRNIGFWLDLRLLLSAVIIVFWLRFNNDWDLCGDYSKTLKNYRKKFLGIFKTIF